MLASIITRQNGRVLVFTGGGTNYWNGGTPVNAAGTLITSSAAPQTYAGGLAYDAAGALCIAADGATIDSVGPGGLALSGGKVAISGTNAIANYIAGLPVDAQGRLCIGYASDSDADAWKANVLANGGTVSNNTHQAITVFAANAKAKGYWNKLNRINLFCGDQLAAALVPLKVGAGTPLDTAVAFVAGDYSEATALTGNGSTKYLNTGLIANTLNPQDTHLAVYNRSTIPSGGGRHLGVTDASSNNFGLAAPLTNSNLISNAYDGAGGLLFTGPMQPAFGFMVGSRVSGTDHAIYRNGVLMLSNATGTGTLPAFPVAVFCSLNHLGGGSSFTSHSLGGYSIGSGLTPQNVIDYYTDIQIFQIALGRGVNVIPADPDAADWCNRVTQRGLSNSTGWLDSTAQAVNNFCVSAKANGYWNKLNRINLFCGNNINALFVPLKIGNGNTIETNIAFVSGDYSEATGLTGNGSSKYLKTGLIPSNVLTLNSTHISVYNRSASMTLGGASGCISAGAPNYFKINHPHSNGDYISQMYGSPAGTITLTGTGATGPYGLIVGSRTDAVTHKLYRAAIAIGETAINGGGLPSVECYIYAHNNSGAAGHNCGHILAGYSIGAGLTPADVANYNTDMQAFQTALGRAV